jgi:hypothetical protein
MTKGLSTLLLALALAAIARPIFAVSTETLKNDIWWYDNTGNPIYAQGGGLTNFNGTWYWYGVQFGGSSAYYSSGSANSDTSFVQINVYTSPDLADWTPHKGIVTTSTSGFSSSTYVGRLGNVIYNSSTKLYVMWVVYQGSDGDGVACLTSSAPTGPFTMNNLVTSIANVYDNAPGDLSIFSDPSNNLTPYLIFSDAHGRQHAYISTLSSNYESINAATLIDVWPEGQEANNMFEYNGYYYYITSNLAGWGYSSAYAVWSKSILTPGDYTADAAFAGTTADDTHYSQVGRVIEIQGSSATSYISVSDRWADFDGDYASVGHGVGYNEWSPISFSGQTPTFNSVDSLTINAGTGVMSW